MTQSKSVRRRARTRARTQRRATRTKARRMLSRRRRVAPRRRVTRRQPGGGKKKKGKRTAVDLKTLLGEGPSVLAEAAAEHPAEAAGAAAGQAQVLANFRPDWKSYRPGDLRQTSGEPVRPRVSEVSPLDVARAWSTNGKFAVIRAWGKRKDGWFLSFGPLDDHDLHIHLMSNGIISFKGAPWWSQEQRPNSHLRRFVAHGDTPAQVVAKLAQWAEREAQKNGVDVWKASRK
jgi:hypothetical protein